GRTVLRCGQGVGGMKIMQLIHRVLPTAPGRMDTTLLMLWLMLMSLGLVIIASSSVAFAAEQYGDPWFFTKRHSVYLLLGVGLAAVVSLVPVHMWQRYGGWLLLIVILLLVVVLIPGVGKEVNGSRRWLD